MKMYVDYLRERTGDRVAHNDMGFAVYRFVEEKTVYIVDIYVKPDFRKQGVAGDIADIVVDLAKQRGCTKLIGSVVPSANGSTVSMRVLLGYGMTLDSSANDFILFKKEI